MTDVVVHWSMGMMGTIATFAVAVMLAISSDSVKSAMGPFLWRRTHVICQWCIWAMLFSIYGGRYFREGSDLDLLVFALLVLIAVFRFAVDELPQSFRGYAEIEAGGEG